MTVSVDQLVQDQLHPNQQLAAKHGWTADWFFSDLSRDTKSKVRRILKVQGGRRGPETPGDQAADRIIKLLDLDQQRENHSFHLFAIHRWRGLTKGGKPDTIKRGKRRD